LPVGETVGESMIDCKKCKENIKNKKPECMNKIAEETCGFMKLRAYCQRKGEACPL